MTIEPVRTPTDPLATARTDRTGRHLTVSLAGELDLASTPGISATIAGARRAGDEHLWLDLREVTFCDSSGLALLFRLRRETAEAGTAFALADPTDPVRRLIAACDVSGVLPIRSSADR